MPVNVDELESLPSDKISGPDAVAAVVAGTDFEPAHSGEGGSMWSFMDGDIPSIYTSSHGMVYGYMDESEVDYSIRCLADSVTRFPDVDARARFIEIHRSTGHRRNEGPTGVPTPRESFLEWLDECRPRLWFRNPWLPNGIVEAVFTFQPIDNVGFAQLTGGDFPAAGIEVELPLAAYARLCSTIELVLPDLQTDSDEIVLDALSWTITLNRSTSEGVMFTDLHWNSMRRLEAAFKEATGHPLMPQPSDTYEDSEPSR